MIEYLFPTNRRKLRGFLSFLLSFSANSLVSVDDSARNTEEGKDNFASLVAEGTAK